MGSAGVPIAAFETVWLESNRFADAERQYYEAAMNESKKGNPAHVSSSEKLERQSVNCALDTMKQEPQLQDSPEKHGDTPVDTNSAPLLSRMEKLEMNNKIMKQTIENLTSQLSIVLSELSQIQGFVKTLQVQIPIQAVKSDTKGNLQNGSAAPDDDDDDLDLFGSDEETEDDVKLKEERLKAYAEKKSKKPVLVAKSSVVLDVKPWDDETDMKAMETAVRKVTSDGLVWGASKLVPLAYGIKKLQIVAIVEDEKVSIDWLQETIEDIEDLVQSVDIAAFNKL